MQIIFLSSDNNIINEWISSYAIENYDIAYDLESLENELNKYKSAIVICDYDSSSHDLNSMIASKKVPDMCIVLEKNPAIATGLSLVSHGIKAYGNSRMKKNHFDQMVETVSDNKVWTYPQLTSELVKLRERSSLPQKSLELINDRLSQKEIEIVNLILDGLTNDAIAQETGIKLRTVKAHISSIFSKLHVNDRLSLVLLLK